MIQIFIQYLPSSQCIASYNFFSGDMTKTEYCEIDLDEERLRTFIYAVKNHYWYQMYIDDLPIWGEFDDTIYIEPDICILL